MTSTDLGLMNVADIKCPDDPQGRTYRQINAEKKHSIPIGALVELKSGVRLFVVQHNRDCDQTPMYCLSPDKDDIEEQDKGFVNRKWVGGYSEESLKIIKHPPRFVRTQVKILDIDQATDGIKVFVAGRPANEQIILDVFSLPAEVRQALKIGAYFHAKVNTDDKQKDLIFKDWEAE